jgi:hypothetical protein
MSSGVEFLNSELPTPNSDYLLLDFKPLRIGIVVCCLFG